MVFAIQLHLYEENDCSGGGTTTIVLYDTLAVLSSDTSGVVPVDSTYFQGGLNSAAIDSTSVNGDNVPESRAEGNLVDRSLWQSI
ncbi:MAG: hypothetical protein NZL83_00910 [Candidatus Absconditabacterales bacterium]|nr:hypothetical protein [Candidatus Absconditabacterales bacterium]